jgi:hypothetical protein
MVLSERIQQISCILKDVVEKENSISKGKET